MRSANGALAGLGKAEEANLSLTYELGHGAHRFFDGDFRIHPMLIQQIDAIGAQPAQRTFHRLTNVRRAAVEPGDLSAFDLEPKLGGENDLVAFSSNGSAHQLFVGERTVHFRRIEEAATQLEGPMNCGDR